MPSYSNITLTLSTKLAFYPNDFIQLWNDADNYIVGRVVNYNPNTGGMTLAPITFKGSGTFTTWKASLIGASFPDSESASGGTSGTTGTNGASGTAGEHATSGTSITLPLS